MKIILLFLISAALLTSCNSKTDTKKDETTKDAKNSNTETKKGWSEEDKKQAMTDCIGDPNSEKGNSSQLCDCMLGKGEALFSSYTEMKKNAESNTEFKNVMKECEEKFSK